MIRYLATKAAHEKNPYTVGSREWESYNAGYVSQVAPSLPSPWEMGLAVVFLSPGLIVVALLLILL